MKNNNIVFIAVTDYDNLGVGYMAALLGNAGYQTRTINFRGRKSTILKILKKLDPLLIGFSVIYHGYLNQFIELTEFLRQGGITCHFTAGGHYASLRHMELFQYMPQLDSIIRFEGEYPIVELAKRLSEGSDWRSISSIAFRENNKVITNAIWPQEKELDKFPFPQRAPLREYAYHRRFTAILAGRGCEHNCSFCNTRAFYRQASAPLKRIREPEKVADEMHYLFLKKKCSVFLFHDDDFPVNAKKHGAWTERFCEELGRTGLNKKIIWKINCRPDDVDEDRFRMMKRNGLFLVFLGLEDGTDAGLTRLNKQLNVAANLKSISILKKLNIGFDYGFMLFQPDTTFSSLNENLSFLRQICLDGYTPVTFLKLIPLYETRIEKELKAKGKLLYSDGTGDYIFPEEPMNRYYNFVSDCFSDWQRDPRGVENISKWARNYLSVYSHFFDAHTVSSRYIRKIRMLISASNSFILDNMMELSDLFKSDRHISDENLLKAYSENITRQHNHFRDEIISTLTKLLSFAENQKIKTYT